MSKAAVSYRTVQTACTTKRMNSGETAVKGVLGVNDQYACAPAAYYFLIFRFCAQLPISRSGFSTFSRALLRRGTPTISGESTLLTSHDLMRKYFYFPFSSAQYIQRGILVYATTPAYDFLRMKSGVHRFLSLSHLFHLSFRLIFRSVRVSVRLTVCRLFSLRCYYHHDFFLSLGRPGCLGNKGCAVNHIPSLFGRIAKAGLSIWQDVRTIFRYLRASLLLVLFTASRKGRHYAKMHTRRSGRSEMKLKFP